MGDLIEILQAGLVVLAVAVVVAAVLGTDALLVLTVIYGVTGVCTLITRRLFGDYAGRPVKRTKRPLARRREGAEREGRAMRP